MQQNIPAHYSAETKFTMVVWSGAASRKNHYIEWCFGCVAITWYFQYFVFCRALFCNGQFVAVAPDRAIWRDKTYETCPASASALLSLRSRGAGVDVNLPRQVAF